MSYRYRFYPPEIDDWYDDDFDGRQYYYACYPACCPNPRCFPYNCEPSTNYATCCPNPKSIYNAYAYATYSACSPDSYTATACTPGGCSPNCNPNYCNPRGCRPRGCRPR